MYIFLIALSLLLPLAFLIVGLTLHKHCPKEINSLAGYRTTRSKKSIAAWNEANSYSTKLLNKYSLFVLIIILLADAFAGRSYNYMGAIIMLSMILSLADISLVIMLTEKHLKNMFGD